LCIGRHSDRRSSPVRHVSGSQFCSSGIRSFGRDGEHRDRVRPAFPGYVFARPMISFRLRDARPLIIGDWLAEVRDAEIERPDIRASRTCSLPESRSRPGNAISPRSSARGNRTFQVPVTSFLFLIGAVDQHADGAFHAVGFIIALINDIRQKKS
jgi:hypothetical protein